MHSNALRQTTEAALDGTLSSPGLSLVSGAHVSLDSPGGTVKKLNVAPTGSLTASSQTLQLKLLKIYIYFLF